MCWLEYELYPGTVLSFAPESIGHLGNRSRPPPSLCPHVWHRVHYLAVKPEVLPGQSLSFDLTLDKDELRIELDEIDVHFLDPGRVEAVSSSASPRVDEGDSDVEYNEGDGSSASLKGSVKGIHQGDLHQGDLRDVSWRPQQQLEREDAGQHQGLEVYPDDMDAFEARELMDRPQPAVQSPPFDVEGIPETENQASDSDGQISAPDACRSGVSVGEERKCESYSPTEGESSSSCGESDDVIAGRRNVANSFAIQGYHMCMLNDRERNRRYQDGIRGTLH